MAHSNKITTFAEEQNTTSMAKKTQTAILVELHNPPQGYLPKYVFGSKAAIFEMIPQSILGIGLRQLWSSKLEYNAPLNLRDVTITMLELHSKAQKCSE